MKFSTCKIYSACFGAIKKGEGFDLSPNSPRKDMFFFSCSLRQFYLSKIPSCYRMDGIVQNKFDGVGDGERSVFSADIGDTCGNVALREVWRGD